ncbi:MAG TPA: RHS repeat-associated core domain-containing protein, partial [Candidatus Saccharimonadales bacterium]|nr:RHS repeat-associated core domain-containing protein [Candidatus Saccharimonadales bacterium]
ILKLNYGYGTTDNNGNVQSQTITVPTVGNVNGFAATQTYTYDSLNRLETAQENNGTSWRQNFDYDRFGNRKLIAGTTLPATLTGANNPIINPNNNRIDSAAAGQGNILYDNAGNLTREVGGHTYEYDAENKMVKYDGGATSGGGASYIYDGDGRRVKKVVGGSPLVTTVFVYDVNNKLIAEYSDAASTGTGTSYLTSDTLGSARVITGSSQQVKGRHDYLPFGEELSGGTGGRTSQQNFGADNLRQKFTAKERDTETGLDYFLARYYSNLQGRFTSPDEFSGGPDELFDFAESAAANPTFYADLTDPQSINKYQYSYGNPLRYVDPDGHHPIARPGRFKPPQPTVTERLKNGARRVGQTLERTLNGAASTLSENNGFGRMDAPQNTAGRVIGHVLTGVQVGTEVYAGVTGMIAGGGGTVVTSPACATIVGCAAPAATLTTAAASAVLTTHGVVVGLNTLKNIFFSSDNNGHPDVDKTTVQGTQDQLEDITANQAAAQKIGQPDRIQSVEKSKQRANKALKDIKSSADIVEDQ